MQGVSPTLSVTTAPSSQFEPKGGADKLCGHLKEAF
jgi:hypothetical protein